MYLIINHFSFDYPKKDISDNDIINAFNNLGQLFIELKKLNVELITHSTLSQVSLNDKAVRNYIQSIDDINTRRAIMALIGKVRPLCSDTDLSFENKENIAFGNCIEEVEKIDVCYTFLSCVLFHLDPILTINNLCSKDQFLKDEIKIICDDTTYELINYKLIPYKNVLVKIKEYQKTKLLDEYNFINNWDDYKIFVNSNFSFCKITEHCIQELKSRYSFDNSYSDIFRKKVRRFNDLIALNGGKPKEINFSPLGLGRPESPSRFEKLKKSHVGIKDFSGNDIYLNWHEYIQSDFRVYFEKEDNYVSFVYYEKKISKP
jgi:hypothetical protein